MGVPAFRPPAIPLVTHTPYFCVWSAADRLTDTTTTHWTGTPMDLAGLIRIDGQAFRWAGTSPHSVPAMNQLSVAVHPTRTLYVFEACGVELTVEFLSPLFTDDLDLLTRPVTYLTLEVRSVDGGVHDVSAYVDVNGEWCTDAAHQPVFAFRNRVEGLEVLGIRSQQQAVLGRVGDNVRIDWGSLYLAATSGTGSAIGFHATLRQGFVATGNLPATDDTRFPREARNAWPALALSLEFGRVAEVAEVRQCMLAYDEEYALEYFERRLKPYWKKDGADIAQLLAKATLEASAIRARAERFDAELEAELDASGGESLRAMGSLAYRQCLAAHGIAADFDGTLLMFSKENFSNGCIGTVDVTYPASPFFLHLNPALLRAQIEPILDYSISGRWKFPFAPHDLGTYPKANGQVYGGGERGEEDQMPVEECGNMLCLVAAYTAWSGDESLARKHWATLGTWGDYLTTHGLDPENQLCTDDFAGHLAHNANLSIKAIVGLGALGKLGARLGLASDAGAAASAMASKWAEMASEEDHYRLTFDGVGSWSQKYNLVWDRLLGLGLFPASVAATEIAYYLGKNTPNGLPLDNRQDYTKLDWIYWTASLAESSADKQALLDPTLAWANSSPTRVPMTDWYHTSDGRQAGGYDPRAQRVWGFTARSVVGGLFMPLLAPVEW